VRQTHSIENDSPEDNTDSEMVTIENEIVLCSTQS